MRITIDLPNCPQTRAASAAGLAQRLRQFLGLVLGIAEESIEVEVE